MSGKEINGKMIFRVGSRRKLNTWKTKLKQKSEVLKRKIIRV